MNRHRFEEPRPQEDKPVNWARIRQLYSNMTCRRQPVLHGLVLTGVVVEARGPQEMVAETERVLAKRLLKEEPS